MTALINNLILQNYKLFLTTLNVSLTAFQRRSPQSLKLYSRSSSSKFKDFNMNSLNSFKTKWSILNYMLSTFIKFFVCNQSPFRRKSWYLNGNNWKLNLRNERTIQKPQSKPWGKLCFEVKMKHKNL